MLLFHHKSEMIIPAKSVGTILSGTNFAIDSTTDTLKNNGILVAKSLCSLANDVVPLRLINVSDEQQKPYTKIPVRLWGKQSLTRISYLL
jgi:hypothetical protein